MSEPATGRAPEAILRDYLDTCAEAHALLLEESRHLRTMHALPELDLLQRKRSVLDRLEAASLSLREINERDQKLSHAARELTVEARNLSLRFLLQDRDNEQQLLACAFGN